MAGLIIFASSLACGLWGLYRLVEGGEHSWERRVNGTACLALLVAGFSGGRELVQVRHGTIDRQPSIVNRLPQTVHGAQFAVYRQPSMFIGSTIKTTYHKPDCRYATLMQHSTNYDSHDQARADGKTPCKICLPGQ